MKSFLQMEQQEKKEMWNQWQGNASFASNATVPGHVYFYSHK